MDEIIEYITIDPQLDLLSDLFEKTKSHTPLSYIECGSQSWVLNSHQDYKKLWSKIIDLHTVVHPTLCPLATGFNFNLTINHGVPPHIDIDKPHYYNLLLPVFGTAKINIYKTNQSELEFRHNQRHWKMLNDNFKPIKIGELIVDKPTLLNTNYLHDVEPIHTPRSVWCSRWINIPEEFTFNKFKKHLEDILGA